MNTAQVSRAALSATAIAAAFALLGVGCPPLLRRAAAPAPKSTEEVLQNETAGEAAVETEGAAEEGEVSGEQKEVESTVQKEEASEPALEAPGEEGSFSGAVLAGTTSPLIDFNKADYDRAAASNRLVVLYFYANWCPICREEVPKLYAAFNQLAGNTVVGFRVNYNDSDTDSDEVALARQYGVGYQHTKVFVKGGQRVLKSPETWDTARYLEEIARYSR